MINSIKRHLKFHSTATILIIICYIISILFISVGTSYLNNRREISLDSNTGDINKSVILSISIKGNFPVKEFISYINNDTGKYDIKIATSIGNQNENIEVIGHKVKNEPLWSPHILKGKYFDDKKYIGQKVAVVGSKLESKCYIENGQKYINLGKQKFSVIGIIGREHREVQWSSFVYIPTEYLDKEILYNSLKAGTINLLLLSDKEITSSEEQNIKNNLKNRFSNISDMNVSKSDNSNENISSVAHTVIISMLIFIVAIVNIMAMTLFWILDRRKEIAVRKVLGFTENDIIKLILKEMLLIGMIAVFISIVMQFFLNIAINNIFKLDLFIELNNLIVAIFVVLASILITSIVPIKVILKVKLTEILNL